MMNDEKEFKTSDLGVGAALLASGITLIRLEPLDQKRVAFVFRGENLSELESKYWGKQLTLDAFSHFEAIKQIKNRLHAQRFQL
jgi:hypothetical protein